MAFNDQLADRLDQMAQLLELTGANPFRANAHAKAARTIREATESFEKLADDPEALKKRDGIGAKMADKVVEFATTGKLQEHIDLLAEVPKGLLAVLDIPGLGPKTVRGIWQELGVTDVAQLKAAIDDGSILSVPRMGKKAAEKIAKAIEFSETSGTRLLIGIAMPIAERIVERMEAVEGVAKVAYAGSLRRGKETIGDIDVLVATDDAERAHEAFCTMPEVGEVIARGDTKSSVRFKLEAKGGRWGDLDEQSRSVQVDLRVVPEAGFGAALMYFTGSKEHNIKLRERAQQRGLTLNEYGLFEDDGEGPAPQKRGATPIAADTEEHVYQALELAWTPPELREDRGETGDGELPTLIEASDIKAELHAHTTASDGLMSLDELVERAQQRGFHTIAVTDHSQSSVQAGGLSVERLREQGEQIDALREKLGTLSREGSKVRVLKGSEVDILADGRLDYEDEVLAELDVIVASPHTALSQDGTKATARLIKAIEHPLTHIVGHPSGRLLNRRKGIEPDWAEVFAAAAEHDTALEINCHWLRLDLKDTLVRTAREAGCVIAIDCDVHAPEDYENIRFGVMTARRGWLDAAGCVNTWPAKKLDAWLNRPR